MSRRLLERDGYSQPATSANECWSDSNRDTITGPSIVDHTWLRPNRIRDAADGKTHRARDEAPEGGGKLGSIETEIDEGIRIASAGGRQDHRRAGRESDAVTDKSTVPEGTTSRVGPSSRTSPSYPTSTTRPRMVSRVLARVTMIRSPASIGNEVGVGTAGCASAAAGSSSAIVKRRRFMVSSLIRSRE
jgi:hypothetical protein